MAGSGGHSDGNSFSNSCEYLAEWVLDAFHRLMLAGAGSSLRTRIVASRFFRCSATLEYKSVLAIILSFR